jgi:hypothetical protein
MENIRNTIFSLSVFFPFFFGMCVVLGDQTEGLASPGLCVLSSYFQCMHASICMYACIYLSPNLIAIKIPTAKKCQPKELEVN